MNPNLVATQVLGFLQTIRSSLEALYSAGTAEIIGKIDFVTAKLETQGMDIAEIKAKVFEIYSDTQFIKADTAAIRSELTVIQAKLDFITGKLEGIKLETGFIKADTTAILADTGIIKSDTAAILADTGVIKGDTAKIRLDTGFIKDDTGVIRAEVAAIDLELDGKADKTDIFEAEARLKAEIAKGGIKTGEVRSFATDLVQAMPEFVDGSFSQLTGVAPAIVQTTGSYLVARKGQNIGSAFRGQLASAYKKSLSSTDPLSLSRKVYAQLDGPAVSLFDADTGLTSTGATYPHAMTAGTYGAIAAVSDRAGKVYYFGGRDNTGLLGAEQNSNRAAVYNAATGAFSTLPNMGVRFTQAAGAFDPVLNRVYLIAPGSAVVYVYLPATNSYGQLAQQLPVTFTGTPGIVVTEGGKFVVVGQTAAGPRALMYSAGIFTLLPNPPQALVNPTALLGRDGFVYVFSNFALLLKYNPVEQMWGTTAIAMPYSGVGLAVAALDTHYLDASGNLVAGSTGPVIVVSTGDVSRFEVAGLTTQVGPDNVNYYVFNGYMS